MNRYEIGDTVIEVGKLYKRFGMCLDKTGTVIVESISREKWITIHTGMNKEETFIYYTPIVHGQTFKAGSLYFAKNYNPLTEIDLEKLNDS